MGHQKIIRAIENSPINTYGTYEYDNEVDAVLSAEVGFYTEDGSDHCGGFLQFKVSLTKYKYMI